MISDYMPPQAVHGLSLRQSYHVSHFSTKLQPSVIIDCSTKDVSRMFLVRTRQAGSHQFGSFKAPILPHPKPSPEPF